ncbi:antibiotic biosynthesis monooxygenase family protein [Klebsiella variicola]|uniref:antibiotic biosynthesis monooxygenase family protein n=1 Tax=Klebsiella variicola TaxID=244366 RepID=UPI002B06030D|nr:antibiotic biosynthesis monooxygenase family protein [Klebsiella variicola]
MLINLFTDEAGFMDAFRAAARVITKQLGFISMQLHRASGDSPTYLNYVMWESTEAVRATFTDPAFPAKLPPNPSSVVASPHLFQKVAVPGFCTA